MNPRNRNFLFCSTISFHEIIRQTVKGFFCMLIPKNGLFYGSDRSGSVRHSRSLQETLYYFNSVLQAVG